MTLSELLKVLPKNELIYCNEHSEDGGWMMRGNEWNTKMAEKWNVRKFFVNSKGNLQCHVTRR